MGHRVLVVTDPRSREHQPPPGHPDSLERLDAVQRAVDAAADIETCGSRPATALELERVHSPAHIAHIKSLSEAGGGALDEDTFVSAGTYQAACAAAGAGLMAVERLASDPTLGAAFVATRPAGHHAQRTATKGFCVFNNVAVTAAHLLDLGARVAIVDWDAHHGDGTQRIFWDDDRVLYVSLHQENVFPGTGYPHERGPAPGKLTTVNLPLPAGATGDHYLSLLDEIAAPLAARFQPDWVLVSCGFDAHADDPLAEMALGSDDFALLTERAQALAPGPGRTVVFLEGGYDLDALEESTAAVLSALAGDAAARTPTTGGPGGGRVGELRSLWGLS